MTCGKKSNNAPTEDFILASPAPVDVAAKLSALYRELSVKVQLEGCISCYQEKRNDKVYNMHSYGQIVMWPIKEKENIQLFIYWPNL